MTCFSKDILHFEKTIFCLKHYQSFYRKKTGDEVITWFKGIIISVTVYRILLKENFRPN